MLLFDFLYFIRLHQALLKKIWAITTVGVHLHFVKIVESRQQQYYCERCCLQSVLLTTINRLIKAFGIQNT